MIRPLLLAAALLVSTACTVWDIAVPFTKNLPPPKTPAGVTAHRDLAFISRDTRDLHLDLYVPSTEEPPPLVVYAFGGGFYMGSRHSIAQEPAVWALLDEGFAVATVDYRYSSEAIYPAQPLDVSAALCWLRDEGASFGVDAERMGFAGQSAGAHLVTRLTVGFDDPDVVDPSCGGQSPEPLATLDYFGPTDFTGWTEEDSLVFDRLEDAFGGSLTDDPERVQLANIQARARPDAAPLLVYHGTADPLVPTEQSIDLVAAMTDAGAEATLITIPDGDHGGAPFTTQSEQQRVLDFFVEHLDD